MDFLFFHYAMMNKRVSYNNNDQRQNDPEKIAFNEAIPFFDKFTVTHLPGTMSEIITGKR